jgi:hypothetical protein
MFTMELICLLWLKRNSPLRTASVCHLVPGAIPDKLLARTDVVIERCLLRRICPLLAQSGHADTLCCLSASGGKADIPAPSMCGLLSAFDAKRTCPGRSYLSRLTAHAGAPRPKTLSTGVTGGDGKTGYLSHARA